MLDLYHLDEAGFALTLPTTYSWFPIEERLRVPYEAPQGRRVHAIGAYCSHGVEAGRFVFETYATLPKSRAKKRRKPPEEVAAQHGLLPEEIGPIDAERLVGFLWKVAGRPDVYSQDWQRERLLVIALDNYSVHTSERVKQERPLLEAAGVYLFYLPSYSPELSQIEPIWHGVKHHDLTERSHTQLGSLKQAVDDALTKKADHLLAVQMKTDHLLRAAA